MSAEDGRSVNLKAVVHVSPGFELMPTRLVELSGGHEIHVDRAPIVVGRHPLCDVRLHSVRVSRRHCCLTEVDGAVFVRDLGSSNGTQINGLRVEVGQLHPGDVLSIANVRYRVEDGPAAQPRPKPAPGSPSAPTPPLDPPGTCLQEVD
jgi:predicted component of type VI protein secretion system